MGEGDDEMKDDEDLDESGGGKKLRIAGLEVEEAIRRIEVWLQEVRITWEKNEAEEDNIIEEAWDDVKGGKLRLEDLRKARKEEVGYMVNRGIWEVVPVSRCWAETGKKPLGFRWVDTNKGTEVQPDVRCRLVARDFENKKDNDREDLFAATPPAEAERMALSKAATRSRGERREDEEEETYVYRRQEGAPESEMRSGGVHRSPR